MKKLVLKTALFTLIGVFVFLALFIGGMSLFAPKTMRNFTTSLGMDNLAYKFAVRQYEKSEDLQDLNDVIFRAGEEDKYADIVKYSAIMTTADGFDDFYKDDLADKYYVIINYVYAMSELENENTFTETKRLYEENFLSYSSGNPIYMLVGFTDKFDDEILAYLNGLEANEIILADIATINGR